MKKSMTKIVAQNYLLPNTRKLLAQCLEIPILYPYTKCKYTKYTWVETYAGIRIGKIKHGKYNIDSLHNVLYPILLKMIKPSIIYKPSLFMLFSDIDPISLIADQIMSNNNLDVFGSIINDNTVLLNYDCIRIIKCNNTIYGKFCEMAGVNNMFSIYRHIDYTGYSSYMTLPTDHGEQCTNRSFYTQFDLRSGGSTGSAADACSISERVNGMRLYIKIRYDKSGLIHEYTSCVQYNFDVIKDLFSYEIYDYVVKYYNSYIYNHVHGIKKQIDISIQSKLNKLYHGYKTGVLKDDGRRIDIRYIKYNLCKILSIQQMCYDRLSAFKSINKYLDCRYNEPIPLIFVI